MKKAASKRGPKPKRFGKKEKMLGVKTTLTARDLYERAAESAEMELSDWVRSVLDAAARRQLGDDQADG